MTNESQLHPIFNRPDLPAITETINKKLSAEQFASQQIRRTLTPSVKAEDDARMLRLEFWG